MVTTHAIVSDIVSIVKMYADEIWEVKPVNVK